MMEALPDGFMRLYIGVGRPQEGVSVIDHVLTRFSLKDRQLVNAAEDEAVRGLRLLIEGFDMARLEQEINSFRVES